MEILVAILLPNLALLCLCTDQELLEDIMIDSCFHLTQQIVREFHRSSVYKTETERWTKRWTTWLLPKSEAEESTFVWATLWLHFWGVGEHGNPVSIFKYSLCKLRVNMFDHVWSYAVCDRGTFFFHLLPKIKVLLIPRKARCNFIKQFLSLYILYILYIYILPYFQAVFLNSSIPIALLVPHSVVFCIDVLLFPLFSRPLSVHVVFDILHWYTPISTLWLLYSLPQSMAITPLGVAHGCCVAECARLCLFHYCPPQTKHPIN